MSRCIQSSTFQIFQAVKRLIQRSFDRLFDRRQLVQSFLDHQTNQSVGVENEIRTRSVSEAREKTYIYIYQSSCDCITESAHYTPIANDSLQFLNLVIHRNQFEPASVYVAACRSIRRSWTWRRVTAGSIFGRIHWSGWNCTFSTAFDHHRFVDSFVLWMIAQVTLDWKNKVAWIQVRPRRIAQSIIQNVNNRLTGTRWSGSLIQRINALTWFATMCACMCAETNWVDAWTFLKEIVPKGVASD